MPNEIAKSDDLCQTDPDLQADGATPRPFLQMRPQHFFSNKFDLEIIEDYSKADIIERQEEGLNWLDRLMGINLLLLILLVGVPVLIYCILSTAD